MHSLKFEPVAPWDGRRSDKIVDFTIGFDRCAYVTTAERDFDRYEKSGKFAFPKSKGDRPQSYRIFRVLEGRCERVFSVENEPFNIDHIQPLPDGRFLLASARAYKSGNELERNARVFDENGSLISAFTIGDAVASTQATADGTIWASYFDEGTWPHPNGEYRPGESGLVAWDTQGTKKFEYSPEGALEAICDCYAMNVTGSDVWIYYYSQFPLVKISDFQISNHWEMPISGSGAFAIQEPYALFRGGYQKRDEYHLLDLSASEVKSVATLVFCNSKGKKIEEQAVTAREDSFFILSNSDFYQISIGDVLEQLKIYST